MFLLEDGEVTVVTPDTEPPDEVTLVALVPGRETRKA